MKDIIVVSAQIK